MNTQQQACRRILLPLLMAGLTMTACSHGRLPDEGAVAGPEGTAEGTLSTLDPDPSERTRGPSPMSQVIAQSLRILVLEGGEVTRSGSGVLLSSIPLAADPPSTVLRDEALSRGERPLARNTLVTNAHVVAPGNSEETLRYRIILESDAPSAQAAEFEAQLIALGEAPAMDLALLAFDGPSLTPATFAHPNELSVGAGLFAIAAPYGRELSVSAGILSRIDYERGPGGQPQASLLKTDASIGYGASGGGLFSRESGHLLGIVEGYRTAKLTFPIGETLYSFDIPMPGETFAAPSEKVLRFVREQGLGDLVSQSGPGPDEAGAGTRPQTRKHGRPVQ